MTLLPRRFIANHSHPLSNIGRLSRALLFFSPRAAAAPVAATTNSLIIESTIPGGVQSFFSGLQLGVNNNMAWRSSGYSNTELIENLWRHGLIKDPRAKEAFLKVDRAHYAPMSPYEDSPQSIGHSATISAPHMHATAIEELINHMVPAPNRPAPRVLDIGSGSGYLTHLMAELVGDQGLVVGIEHIKELRDLGEKNMRKSAEGRAFVDSGKVRFRVGDGRKGWVEPPREGEEENGEGWDAIHVGASAVEVHQELLDQLRAPGRMFIPVDDDTDGWSQHVWNIDKDEHGNVSKSKLFGVRYVPLTAPPKR